MAFLNLKRKSGRRWASIELDNKIKDMRALSKLKITSLPYKMSALEPVITEQIMSYHYAKHHVAYVNNFNNLLDKHNELTSKGEDVTHLQKGLKFNYGGHVNHELYWLNLAGRSEGGGVVPSSKDSKLVQEIEKEWNSVDKFIEDFNAKTTVIQGSGWGWLVWDKNAGKVRYIALPNQDLVEDQEGGALVPLLTIDVWEHAYYLKYMNLRPQYMKEIWEIVNWKEVEKRLAAAL